MTRVLLESMIRTTGLHTARIIGHNSGPHYPSGRQDPPEDLLSSPEAARIPGEETDKMRQFFREDPARSNKRFKRGQRLARVLKARA